jgi:hypothetical protein
MDKLITRLRYSSRKQLLEDVINNKIYVISKEDYNRANEDYTNIQTQKAKLEEKLSTQSRKVLLLEENLSDLESENFQLKLKLYKQKEKV